MTKSKYDYDRFGAKGQRVGQAVVDILSKEQPMQTVGETIEAFGPDYAAEIEKTIEQNASKFEDPFYILVITKKEMWACNVVRNWFCARQSEPDDWDMMVQYPNATKTLYRVNATKGDIQLVWTLPGFQDCIHLAKSPFIEAPELRQFIKDCLEKGQKRLTSEAKYIQAI